MNYELWIMVNMVINIVKKKQKRDHDDIND